LQNSEASETTDPVSTAEELSTTVEKSDSDNPSSAKTSGLGLMYGLSAGHGIKHFGQGALLVMIPSIRATLGLGDIAIGGMSSAQSISSGIANIPAGILTDMFRKKIAWILLASMIMVGTGYIIIGVSPVYWILLVGVSIVGFGTSLWHAPAFGTLAARYPERRGFAMAAHLTGAQIGNTTSPLIIGFLLAGTIGSWVVFSGIDWRWLAVIISIPMFMTGLVVISKFKTAGAESTGDVSLREYFGSAKKTTHEPRRTRNGAAWSTQRSDPQFFPSLPRYIHARRARLFRYLRWSARSSHNDGWNNLDADNGQHVGSHRSQTCDLVRHDIDDHPYLPVPSVRFRIGDDDTDRCTRTVLLLGDADYQRSSDGHDRQRLGRFRNCADVLWWSGNRVINPNRSRVHQSGTWIPRSDHICWNHCSSRGVPVTDSADEVEELSFDPAIHP
jgi:hypothetical protein